MSTNSPSSQPRASPHPQSPNPNAPAFRPSPARAATLSGTPFQYKTRAASQPAGERIPPPTASNPGSGRASPGLNGNGGAFGVIGGSRTPGRFGNALATSGGTATRANSFSAGEIREPRNITLNRTLSSHTEEFVPSRSHSTSPFPTFSPNSTPSTSPAALRQHPLPPSPPKVGANTSRSRSQSLATGVRPSGIDRPWLGPMSTLENSGAFAKIETGWNISPPEASNMSPFSRGLSVLSNTSARDDVYSKNGANLTPGGRFRAVQESFNARGGWGASAPEPNTSALSSSVHKALGGNGVGGYGQPPLSSVTGGFGEYNPNGGRSGTSSRRHSVSVVGGPGGRREFAFGEPGMGMTGLASPPNRGLFGFEGDLNNALSLDIDDRQRRDDPHNKDIFVSSSLPRFDPLSERFDNGTNGHQRIPSLNRSTKPDPFNDGAFPSFGSTPPRGRLDIGLGAPGEKGPSGDSKDGTQKRFGLENAAVGSPAHPNIRIGTNGGSTGPGSPERIKDNLPPLRGPSGPGVIGSPASFHAQPPSFNNGPPGTGTQGSAYPGARPYGPGPGAPFGPTGSGIGIGNGTTAGGPPIPHMGGGPPSFGRPPPAGFGGYYSGLQRPPPGPPGYGPTNGSAPGPGHMYGNQTGGPSPSGYPPYYPPPSSPPQPTSPSFSSLSLSDLGKGIILASLPATTPLYVVAFKAGRRDVYYCPDPTLLISNGDKVIVEADRGSDLGTVVYDQLTPIDVRDWQERQATAALLSGASQHQPPGLAVSGQSQAIDGHKRVPSNPAAKEVGEVANMNLDQLLAGVGPSGQLELTGTAVRGPLAKEVMPKRIFAKSSQGPEEQARMREKAQDEYEALMICREKVVQRGLPMTIVDAEYQWDRRKLTFYFKAEKRVDFRDLTKENFRIFKSRIWMSMVSKDDPRV
ncbi:hypothetical protein IAT40_007593 [Kwoniella sp. CBS 6097]